MITIRPQLHLPSPAKLPGAVLPALVDIDEALVLIVDGEYGDGGTIKLTA